MDELSAMLSQFLGSEEGQAQLNAVASALGMGGAPSAPAPPQPQPAGGQLDIASLLNSLQPAAAPARPSYPPPQAAAQPPGGGIDMAALGGLLQSLTTPPPPPPPAQRSGLDLSALAGLLGGGASSSGAPPPSANPLPGLDMSALMGLQRAFSAFSADKNTALLLALKPSLSPERQKKVDDAVRILQLLKLLPLIKETGLFGDMSWLTGGGNR